MYQFTDDFNFASGDLCNPNPCGVDADCKPGSDRSGNDRPVCFCRAGYLGDPLVSCRRGQCIDHAVIQPFIDKIPKQQNFKITFFYRTAVPTRPVTATSALTLARALHRDPSAVLEPVVMPVIMAPSALVPSVTMATHSQSAAFLSTAVKLHYITKQCHNYSCNPRKSTKKKNPLAM